LGVLVVALLGLGGWADYQYGLVGLLPAETSSSPPSIAEDGDEVGPSEGNLELPNDNSGDDGNERELGGDSGLDGGQQGDDQAGDSGSENDQLGSDGNESSSQGQSEDSDQAPDEDFGNYGGNGDGEDESESDETQEERDESTGDSAGSDRNDSDAGNEQEADGSATGSSEESEETLGAKAVAAVQEGRSLTDMVPHDKFDPETHRIETVEGTVEVRAETELNSGALLTVEPKGRFTYDPNGAFKALGAGEDTTDRFTYTAVSESGDKKLRGTVKVPIRGENTPPELKRTRELTLRAEQVSPIPSRALTATDPDDGAEELQFTVTEEPTRGEIRVGDSSATASAASSFTQRDIEEGRVFYVDMAGKAGEDAFTVAVKDEGGAGSESESFRVKVEPAEAQDTSADTEEKCRIQFAAPKKESEKSVEVEDFPRAKELEKTTDLTVGNLTVKEYTTNGKERFGLFLKQAGTESEMKAKLEEMEDVPNDTFVHCFDR